MGVSIKCPWSVCPLRVTGNSKLLIQLSAVCGILVWLVQRNLARLFDLALLLRWGSVLLLDLTHKLHAFQDCAEDHMPSIEMRRSNRGDEELAAVGVLSGVGHGQQPTPLVLQLEVLVRKLLTVDGLAPRAVALGEVTALDHEVLDHAVELGALLGCCNDPPQKVCFTFLGGVSGKPNLISTKRLKSKDPV